MRKKRIVIKVGTHVLQQENGKLDYHQIRELGEQLSAIYREGYEVVFVSSGAVGAGRELNTFPDEKNNLLRKQMMAAIGQGRLMQTYSEVFTGYEITIAQVLINRADFGHRPSYLNIRNTLEGLLKAHVLPIINENDVVGTEELANQFGDNDQLAVFVSAMLGADSVFFLTTAEGFMMKSAPKEEPQVVSTVEKFEENLLEHCNLTLSKGGKGGMASKVKAAGMAMSFGIDAYIVSGKERNIVQRVLEGESIGTHFQPTGTKVTSYQKWLVAGALSKGIIQIDDGASHALQKNKSLLLRGVTEVKGNFESRDLVDILNSRGKKIGVGRSDWTAKELRKQLQDIQKEKEQQAIKPRRPAIHKDHLYLTH